MAGRVTETKRRLLELCHKPFGEVCAFYRPLGNGKIFTHRMRVELSRVRKNLERKGQEVMPFKVFERITEKDGQDFVELWRQKDHTSMQHIKGLDALEQLLIVTEKKNADHVEVSDAEETRGNETSGIEFQKQPGFSPIRLRFGPDAGRKED